MKKAFTKLLVGATLFAAIPAFGYDSGMFMKGLNFTAPTIDGKVNVYSPVVGEIIFDSSDSMFYGFNGSSWSIFNGLTSGTQAISGVKTFVDGAIIKGVTDGSAASAGYIGELIESSMSSSVTPGLSGYFSDVTSITLTPGSWDVSGALFTLLWGATPTTNSFLAACISTSSGSPDEFSGKACVSVDAHETGNNIARISPTPLRRIDVSVNTTIYLVARYDYTSLGSTTYTQQSYLRATRVR